MKDAFEQARNIDLQWFGEGNDPSPAIDADNQVPVEKAETPPAGGEQGNGEAPRWIFQTEKELQGDKRLHRFPTLSAAARALLETEDKLAKSVEIPGDDATPEQTAAFYARLGRPEQAEQYALAPPEAFKADGEFLKNLREKAHAANFSQKQAQAALDFFAEWQTAREQKAKADEDTAFKVGHDNLRKLYGPRTDEKLARAHDFIKTAGSDDALAALAAKGLDNHPAIVAMFARAGEIIGEDVFLDGKISRKTGPYSYMNE